jgi:hypothetical protein
MSDVRKLDRLLLVERDRHSPIHHSPRGYRKFFWQLSELIPDLS